jgi:phenylacetate-CoA ligase
VIENRAARRYGDTGLWNPTTMTMDRAALDDRHLVRIKRLVHYAYGHSPLHRRLYDETGFKPSDLQTWDDFHEKVPVTDKDHYVEEQERLGVAGRAMSDDLVTGYFHTTGTTGSFLHEHYSESDKLRMSTIFGYAWWDAGVRPGDSVLVCHNFGFWLGLWHMYWAARFFGLTTYTAGGMSTDDRIDAVVEHRPTMVAGTPTYLFRLAHRAEERGIDLAASSVRFLVSGGEPGLSIPVTRRALENAWGAVGIDAYGLSEVGIAHLECGAHPMGVHVMEDSFHAYSADLDTGEPVGEGEIGENMVTAYTHLAQPFIKYRTHDIVRRYDDHDHGCGWTWGFLDGSVLGRTDFMVSLRGTNIYPSALENLIGDVGGLTPFYEIHISREDDTDHMLVRVEAGTAVEGTEYETLRERLEALYRSRLGVKIEVQVCVPQTVERQELKTNRIFDHRDRETRPPFWGGSAKEATT